MQPFQTHFWNWESHPAADQAVRPLRIVQGNGCYLYDDQGNELVDGSSGLWNVIVGHNRREIKQAITQQLDELEYSTLFGGAISHPRAEELAQRLVEMLQPEGMRRVFFSQGGSDAIETALKLARQYWKIERQPERTKFIALQMGYHGTHFGSAAVNGFSAFRRNYEPNLSGVFHVEPPWLYRNPFTQDPDELGRICATLLEREIVFQGADTVAAFIAEPIQGAGGVIVPPANYWPLVREVCDRHGVLLIADEVVTGFGRTGELFGSRLWNVRPDIMCFAKGISSGYAPLGATVVNERIEHAFHSNSDFTGAIMHGYTNSGHPTGCAAALATLDIVVREQLVSRAAAQGDYLLRALRPFAERFATVGDVRGKGLLVGLDLVKDKSTREPVDMMGGYANKVCDIARAHGALVRPMGTVIVAAPPFVVDTKQLDVIVAALAAGLEEAPLQ
ncbi:aminotransferase class III-fold pyridoxal phosphate-dependent enzyme [Paraburkholderia solisilvae]|uniref:Putrescine--pyruvate aminotransferase n=1 Tax=Paraburkholderia solisilvae TaxID=624376 RepID=A0A6J5DIN0_9BURK|nr:aminotransferase class III-fold pyridoxal phosphate-dependent enzyme [Paraburkholderia solisilvae]CAB3752736.1 Putrescine--pyruvate aminotransferase [Paraburkholderia solisilvae]